MVANADTFHDYHQQNEYTRRRKMDIYSARGQRSIISTDSSETTNNGMSAACSNPNNGVACSNSGSSFSKSRSKMSDDHFDDFERRSPSSSDRNTDCTRTQNSSSNKIFFAESPTRSSEKKEKRKKKSLSSPGSTELNGEITEFLGIVSELEEICQKSSLSPVERWEFNKLTESANSLSEKIEQKLFSGPLSPSNIQITSEYRQARSTLKVLNSAASIDQKDKSSQQNPIQNNIQSFESGCSGLDSLSAEMREMETTIQREDEYNTKIMKEREAEVSEINEKMHKVNEIYKDLGDYVQSQQELIDKVDDNVDEANANAQNGLDQVEQANRGSLWRRRRRTQTDAEEEMERDFTWEQPFQTIKEDLKDVSRDFVQASGTLLNSLKFSLKTAIFECTQPDATASDFIS